MFINVWYVAAFSSELDATPLKITILGADLVLFRDADGVAHCISNVCPHRGASLADGVVYQDGALACPFHGWRFDGTGGCTLIPSRRDHDPAVIAPAAKTDAYATIEKYGCIWVCLGDDPDAAYPIFDMPEWDHPDWRATTNAEVWEADFHTAKFTNLDYVHLPVVHGILFRSHDNPYQAPEHDITATPEGYQARMYVNAQPSEGVWSTLREDDAKVESVMRFFVPGFTLRGQVEIGGVGSGVYNMFYEFTTPIDEQRCMMRHIFLRNYKLEAEFDTEHTRRNLQNVHQDKRIAEAQRPRLVPDGPDPDGIYTHDEDRIVLTYWRLMEQMRERGWQIDRTALPDPDRAVRVIPSPRRRSEPDGWVHQPMPLLPPSSFPTPVAKLRWTDLDSVQAPRAKDYGEFEPVVPQDARSKATLEWEDAALQRVDKAPSFVQPMIIANAEQAARDNGSNFVSVKLLDELAAQQNSGS